MIKLLQSMFFIVVLMSMAPAAFSASTGVADFSSGTHTSAETVMQQFGGDDEVSPQRKIDLERKHQILFLMGITLLVLLLITGTLGIAMVAFDKDVFLPHMIFAGMSLTLAIVHSATAIAWFWPW